MKKYLFAVLFLGGCTVQQPYLSPGTQPVLKETLVPYHQPHTPYLYWERSVTKMLFINNPLDHLVDVDISCRDGSEFSLLVEAHSSRNALVTSNVKNQYEATCRIDHWVRL